LAGAHTHTTDFEVRSDLASGSNNVGLRNSQVPAEFQPVTSSAGAHTHVLSGSTANAGSGAAHVNLQPTFLGGWMAKL